MEERSANRLHVISLRLNKKITNLCTFSKKLKHILILIEEILFSFEVFHNDGEYFETRCFQTVALKKKIKISLEKKEPVHVARLSAVSATLLETFLRFDFDPAIDISRNVGDGLSAAENRSHEGVASKIPSKIS